MAVKKIMSIFFFLHISFVHESSVFEKTCVKREINPDAVVLDLCFLCVCVCVCVSIFWSSFSQCVHMKFTSTVPVEEILLY